jgi:hypothetical protein
MTMTMTLMMKVATSIITAVVIHNHSNVLMQQQLETFKS